MPCRPGALTLLAMSATDTDELEGAPDSQAADAAGGDRKRGRFARRAAKSDEDGAAARGAQVTPGTAGGSEPQTRRALPGRLVYVTTFMTAAIWLLLDQATKVLAVTQLPATGVAGREFGVFDLRLVRNPGGAFGIPGFPGLFLVVTILVIILVVRALPRTDRLLLAAVYGLVSGGALGNVADRLLREPGFPSGHVVDFVDLGWWPVFNLADVGIVIGALGIAILLSIVDREERQAEAARAAHQSVRPGSSTSGP